ncbi:MAG TPA: DUF1963 domain-containing protein [Thiolinea sp.]|nr:DUF1963 domain-containing protein [Thiolinea sp.]
MQVKDGKIVEYMVKALAIEFIPTTQPCTKLVTKFGGQPVWLTEAQWPLSVSTEEPMKFIGQIVFDETIFPQMAGKVAYLFITENDGDVDLYVDRTYEPDGGENAVIIQPSLIEPSVKTSRIFYGPTLYEKVLLPGRVYESKKDCEFITDLKGIDDPKLEADETLSKWTDEQVTAYEARLAGNKLGGTPAFIQGVQYPNDEDTWQLALQFGSMEVPFYLDLGGGMVYIFINKAGTLGKMLSQCT